MIGLANWLNKFRKPQAVGGGGDTSFITSVSGGTVRNNFDGVVGFKLTVSSSITVTSLGRWCRSSSTQTHRVAIWDSVETKLVEVSLDATGGAGAFKYVSCTATVLSAGTYYVGSEEFNGGDSWLNDDSTIATTAGATMASSSFHSGSYDAPNSLNNAGVFTFGPPNFLYH